MRVVNLWGGNMKDSLLSHLAFYLFVVVAWWATGGDWGRYLPVAAAAYVYAIAKGVTNSKRAEASR